ncbi:MAG: cytidylate kinase [Candidatus Paceibacteria bacterium]|jgi:cytidylate kinase
MPTCYPFDMKKKIITIAGKLGSGKSSAAKSLAKDLDYRHYSSGDFFRSVASERNLTVTELNQAAETDPQIDIDIDEKNRQLNNETNLVADSRTAFHWVPDSFKVYLDIDPDTAIRRIMQDLVVNVDRQKSEEAYSGLEEAKERMLERYTSENKRYKDLYGIDPSQHDNYSLVIDTGLPENDLESVVNQIKDAYKKWVEDR